MNDQPPISYNPPPEWQSSPPPNYPSPSGSSPWQPPTLPLIQPGYPPPSTPFAYDRPMTVPLRISRLAPAGLILGIISLIVSLGIFVRVPVLALIFLMSGFITSTAGIIFSALSLRSVSRKAMAVVGLALSITTFVLLLLLLLLGLLVSSTQH
jgi:hypothetical protein